METVAINHREVRGILKDNRYKLRFEPFDRRDGNGGVYAAYVEYPCVLQFPYTVHWIKRDEGEDCNSYFHWYVAPGNWIVQTTEGDRIGIELLPHAEFVKKYDSSTGGMVRIRGNDFFTTTIKKIRVG